VFRDQRVPPLTGPGLMRTQEQVNLGDGGPLISACIIRHVWVVTLVLWFPYAALSDVVMLRNGDRLTGTVLGKQKGETLNFESGDDDVLHFSWKEVRALLIDRSTTVVLKNGESVTGPLVMGVDREAVSSLGETPTFVEITKVEVIRSPQWSMNGGWRSRGTASLSVKIETGNTELEDVDADLHFTLQKQNNRVSFTSEIEREQADGIDSMQQWSAKAQYDRFFETKTYGVLAVSSESDALAELALRNWVALGVGHDLHDDRTFRAGGQVLLLRVLDENETEDSDRYWAARLNCNIEKMLFEGRLTYFLICAISGDVEGTKHYFAEGRTGCSVPIWGGVIAIAEIKAEYDNLPSGEDESSDYTYRLKLGYRW
jgi:hypothetical protein